MLGSVTFLKAVRGDAPKLLAACSKFKSKLNDKEKIQLAKSVRVWAYINSLILNIAKDLSMDISDKENFNFLKKKKYKENCFKLMIDTFALYRFFPFFRLLPDTSDHYLHKKLFHLLQ